MYLILFTPTLQKSRMPQILGVEGEAAPGRGRRTLDNAGDARLTFEPLGIAMAEDTLLINWTRCSER